MDVFIEYVAGCVCASLTIMLAGARGESIEEPDEQDRQIKMLAKLLESKAGKLSTTRNKESLTFVWETSFAPLVRENHAAANKFAAMYVDLLAKILVGGGVVDCPSIEEALATVPFDGDAVSSFLYTANFANLKFRELDQTSHHWQIRFELYPASYQITVDNNGYTLKKAYDQSLSAGEIESIKTYLVKRHIRELEEATGASLTKL